jgi:REP element-mobilizing transposase RayT
MTYLVTWSTYASHIPHRSEALIRWRRTHLRFPPLLLIPDARREVLAAIHHHARTKDYALLAVHVRETHVHVLVSCRQNPFHLCAAWKALSARRLRESGLVPASHPVWADYRNVRRLRSRDSICRAMNYVVNKQGPPMELWQVPPDFPL